MLRSPFLDIEIGLVSTGHVIDVETQDVVFGIRTRGPFLVHLTGFDLCGGISVLLHIKTLQKMSIPSMYGKSGWLEIRVQLLVLANLMPVDYVLVPCV